MNLNGILLSHYRRHPVQALFLLTGIIVANVLLAGTLLINAQARSSYAQGEQYLSATPVGQIRQKDGTRNIDEGDYVSLRRQGFDMLAPLSRRVARTENGEALELVGLADRAHHYPNQLSGGQQQRVAIARALVNQPRVLLADEPTGNLHDTLSRQVMELMVRLVAESACSLLLVTHNREMASYADRQLVLEGGRLHELA